MKINIIDGQTNDVDDLRQALAAADVVGTWDWDPVAQLFRFDEGGAQLLAGDRGLAGQDLDVAAATTAVHDQDFGWLREEMRRVRDIGAPFLTEYRVIAEGRVRWILMRGQFTQDLTGKTVRGRGILIDVTKQHDLAPDVTLSGDASSGDLLNDAALYCIRAHRAVEQDGSPLLKALLDGVLLELGREIARRIHGRAMKT